MGIELVLGSAISVLSDHRYRTQEGWVTRWQRPGPQAFSGAIPTSVWGRGRHRQSPTDESRWRSRDEQHPTLPTRTPGFVILHVNPQDVDTCSNALILCLTDTWGRGLNKTFDLCISVTFWNRVTVFICFKADFAGVFNREDPI